MSIENINSYLKAVESVKGFEYVPTNNTGVSGLTPDVKTFAPGEVIGKIVSFANGFYEVITQTGGVWYVKKGNKVTPVSSPQEDNSYWFSRTFNNITDGITNTFDNAKRYTTHVEEGFKESVGNVTDFGFDVGKWVAIAGGGLITVLLLIFLIQIND